MTTFATILQSMGFIRFPLMFAVIAVMVLSVLSVVKLADGQEATSGRTKAWIDGVLFWGGFALIAGVLGTLIGIIVAAQSIEAAGAVHSTLVWGGVKVALLSSAFGLVTLAGATLVWFVLQLRWRLLVAERLDALGH